MSRKLDRNNWIVEIFCVVFILANVGLFIHGVLEFGRARRSPSWPTVKGTVEISVSSGSGYDVTCSYEVDGQTFTCYQVGFGEKKLLFNSDDAQRVQRRYPKGTIVDLYYDPADPEISVLEPGVRPGTYNALIIPVLLALMAIGFWLFHHRMARPAGTVVRNPRSKGV